MRRLYIELLHVQHAISTKEPLLIGRDDSDDVLEKRRISSDLRFALKTYSPVIYKSASPCTSSMLKSIVLGSNHMNHVICQLSDEWGEPAETFRKKATMILEEMADNLHLSAIRLLAFILSKVFKRVFRRIRVNTEGIERLKKALSDNPVVLLPNHRSYMDFLILSFVFYTYDLNIPVIAARGLLEIKILSTILRRSGAFYIRREIGTNKLYWAVLSEYVKTMLRMGYAPIEFYVEGARSRSFKSLLPKLGLLNIVTDAFLKKEVADVTLVPISITYERPVDETLHAHDLLGLPKIKESMWALFKARKILGQDFGTSSIHLGEPVSLKALVQGDVNLSQYNLDHRHIPHRPSQEIKAFLHHTGCRMIHLQEENMVISPFVLVATILMQKLICSISLHRNIVKIDNGKTMLVQEQQADSSTDKHLMQYAVTVLTCSMYRNQILHIFVRPALAAMALSFTNKTQKEEIFICYSFLQDLFSSEFVFLPGNAKQDFEEACHRLSEWGAVQISKQNIELTETGPLVIFFILSIFQPFLEGYQLYSNCTFYTSTCFFVQVVWFSSLISNDMHVKLVGHSKLAL
uniref:Glyceronephosphate O-acyltransferase n=1 Tax=Erpetoichthys calabaricus TaxID=27687 RepID=A0A8C4RG91_ERPCA